MKRRPLFCKVFVDLLAKTGTAFCDSIRPFAKATEILPGLPGRTVAPNWRHAGLFFLFLSFFVFNAMAAETLAAGRTVGGAVAGLAGTGLVLQNNDGDDLAVDADGAFAFDTGVEDGQTYQVAVAVQPAYPDQWCNVYNASGTVSGTDVSDIEVVCVTGLYNVVDTNYEAC